MDQIAELAESTPRHTTQHVLIAAAAAIDAIVDALPYRASSRCVRRLHVGIDWIPTSELPQVAEPWCVVATDLGRVTDAHAISDLPGAVAELVGAHVERMAAALRRPADARRLVDVTHPYLTAIRRAPVVEGPLQ